MGELDVKVAMRKQDMGGEGGTGDGQILAAFPRFFAKIADSRPRRRPCRDNSGRDASPIPTSAP